MVSTSIANLPQLKVSQATHLFINKPLHTESLVNAMLQFTVQGYILDTAALIQIPVIMAI